MMDQNHGNNPPSGSEPKKSPRVKCPRVNWKQAAQNLQVEVEQLQEELKLLRDEHASIIALKEEMKLVGWGHRHKVMLNSLEHFYGRVLNAQMKCKEDKAYLDNLVEDAQHIIKNRLDKRR